MNNTIIGGKADEMGLALINELLKNELHVGGISKSRLKVRGKISTTFCVMLQIINTE